MPQDYITMKNIVDLPTRYLLATPRANTMTPENGSMNSSMLRLLTKIYGNGEYLSLKGRYRYGKTGLEVRCAW